jgi:hypothetical protein
MAFALSGDNRSAAGQFELLGDQVTEWPWQYLNGRDPGAAYLKWRTPDVLGPAVTTGPFGAAVTVRTAFGVAV